MQKNLGHASGQRGLQRELTLSQSSAVALCHQSDGMEWDVNKCACLYWEGCYETSCYGTKGIHYKWPAQRQVETSLCSWEQKKKRKKKEYSVTHGRHLHNVVWSGALSVSRTRGYETLSHLERCCCRQAYTSSDYSSRAAVSLIEPGSRGSCPRYVFGTRPTQQSHGRTPFGGGGAGDEDEIQSRRGRCPIQSRRRT